MNKIDYTHAIKILTAANAGKIIQFRSPYSFDRQWDISNIDRDLDSVKLRYLNDPEIYRVAPEIEYVPLGSEDIPPVCWINHRPQAEYARLVTYISTDYLIADTGKDYTFLFEKGYYYSEDRKDWKLCRKEKV